ncbi:type II secretion system protein GspK [bacterium]|nr:type II secretion system protein GspK [bacterium]
MKTRYTPTNRSRGAVLIIVVALLGVLALVLVTLSYGSRVDYLAARNWANSVQSRMAAVSELPAFQSMNGAANGITLMSAGDDIVVSADGSRQLNPVPLQLLPLRADSRAATSLASAASRSNQLADVTVSDTSAKLNINAVVPVVVDEASWKFQDSAATAKQELPIGFIGESELARLISGVMDAEGITGVDPQTLAHAIALHRYGKDGKPGFAGEDDNNNAKSALSSTGTIGTGIRADRLDNDRDGKIDNKEESLETDGIDNNYNGHVDEAGEGTDDPAECLGDPRLEPNGDDTPYTALGELMAIPGMTARLYAALAPHLTVLSTGYAAFQLPAQSSDLPVMGWPQLDPNTAPPELIYASLKKRFPNAAPDTIGQFTANLVDRRDKDSVPCEIELDGAKYRGQEVTPYINEICTANYGVRLKKNPRHGQYVEIINPYAKAKIDVDGWTIAGAGGEIALSGKIQPGGYIVITDDYNDQNDKGRGSTPDSFFANFGVVSSGPDEVIIENRDLDLMAGNGHLELKDSKGDVIDTFDFDPQVRTGVTLSFQKTDPRLNVTRTAAPTPLRPNSGSDDDGINSDKAKLALQTLEQTANKPINNPIDAMLISTAHVATVEKADSTELQDFKWQLPELNASSSRQLDTRLVDCFLPNVAMPLKNKTKIVTLTSDETDSNQSIRELTVPNAAVISGRVNINTAPLGVLAALPGMSNALLMAIRDVRAGNTGSGQSTLTLDTRDRSYWREIDPKNGACWANLSDLITDKQVWGDTAFYDRLAQVYAFAPLIGTHSLTMMSVATTKVASAGETKNANAKKSDLARRENITRAERLLAADRGVIETVHFAFVGSAADAAGDPDARTATTLTQARGKLLYPPNRLAAAMGRTVRKTQ